MYRNYFFLHRAVLELNSKIKNHRVVEVFSQDKNEIIFHLNYKTNSKYLIFSVSQNDPYIRLIDAFARAKRNTIDFFPFLLDSYINNVLIAENDRIIKLILEDKSINFIIRGKDTNVLAFDKEKNAHLFKKMSRENKESISKELFETIFIIDPIEYNLKFDSEKNYFDSLKQCYPFFNRDIVKEIKSRASSENHNELMKATQSILAEIHSNPCFVMFDSKENVGKISHFNISEFNKAEKFKFDSTFEAFEFYLKKKAFFINAEEYKRITTDQKAKELEKLSKKIAEINNNLSSPSREEELRKYAELLSANRGILRKGLKSVIVVDYINNKEICIPIDKSLNAEENINSYFSKARNEKVKRENLKRLLEKLYVKKDKLVGELEEHKNMTLNENTQSLIKTLKKKNQEKTNQETELSTKFRSFIIDNRYKVYVGKDSKNNDLLTLKFAKPNDYWLHARGVSGSHVIIRVDNLKEPMPKSVIKKAAQIAAYFSKSKTSKLVPVIYTLKKYVVKRKGMPAGQVSTIRESVIDASPQIPIKDSIEN